MADNPIKTPLPADLPTDWTYGQTVAPAGSDAGLSQQHGYNYLMRQVNAAQQGVNELGEALKGVPSLEDGKVPVSQLPVGTANGVAGLDENGQVPAGQLPEIDAGDIASGILGIARGGTGQATLTPAVDTVALRASYAGTTDLTAGSSALTTGALYFVYE